MRVQCLGERGDHHRQSRNYKVQPVQDQNNEMIAVITRKVGESKSMASGEHATPYAVLTLNHLDSSPPTSPSSPSASSGLSERNDPTYNAAGRVIKLSARFTNTTPSLHLPPPSATRRIYLESPSLTSNAV